MAIPAEILAVARPTNTRVKLSGNRYLVVKRTCKRVNGKNIPVELGTIGEIKDGKYVEIRKVPRKIEEKKQINIKQYGTIGVCHKVGKSLLQDLKTVFEKNDAEKLYCIALLRACEPDIRNRDIKLTYDTTYLSEIIPGVALSENTICTFLRDVGMEYLSIQEFLKKREKKFIKNGSKQVIDSTLKNNNSEENTLSEFTRKGREKGREDISIMYSYDLETKEPILMKTYSGNVLDVRLIKDFVNDFSVEKGILVMDKGFYSKENINMFKSIKGLSYILPLKRAAKKIDEYNMYDEINQPILVCERQLLYKKTQVDDTTFLYSFRDPKIASEEEISYLKNTKNIESKAYEQAKKEFGVITFETNKDLTAEEVYVSYDGRWEIETLFQMFKDVLDLDTENVHSDYSIITSEFINYLSVILAQRMKTLFQNTVLKEKKNKKGEVISTSSVADNYSFRQIMRYLSKVKMVQFKSDKWIANYPANAKYIQELAVALDIVD